MRIVSTAYSKTDECNSPVAWLERISFYTGILEELAIRHEVTSFERIDHEGSLSRNKVDYRFIRLTNHGSRVPLKMHREIKQLSPDLVLVNGLIFPLQVMQLRRFLRKGARIFVIHRSELPGRGIRRFLQAKADPYIDAYLFPSIAIAERWVKAGVIRNRQKIYELMHASSHFTPLPQHSNSRQLHFLWVGRPDPNKDPLTVVKAFVEFQKQYPAARLDMICDRKGMDASLQATIDNCSAIHLQQPQPHSQMEQWYRQADFYISGSHYEGGGISVLEALSCGCIPLLSDIDAFRSITGNKEIGLFFPPGDARALLAVLQHAIELDRQLESQKVLAHFKKHLSFESIAHRIISISENLPLIHHVATLPG